MQSVSSKKKRFVFLDYLRISAAWLVVYDHMFGEWTARHGVNLRLVGMIRTYISNPFGIIQNFGWMAVAVFFLISGFIITHVSQRESVAEFTVKRALRIFPVTALFVVISLVLNPHMRVGFTFGDFIRNVTLTNYFIYPQVLTIGVAWTLVIEVVFYVMTAMTMGVRNQWLTVIANLSIPLLAISVCRSYGNDFFLFAVCMSYVPYLVVGQIFYLALYDRSIGILAAIFALVACFGVLMDGIMTMSPAFALTTNSYMISFVYACGIFCVMLQLRHHLRSTRVVKFLADSSFAVYMVHGVVGYAVFQAVWPVGPRLAIIAALATTLVGSAILHLWIEKPILAFGRRLVGKLGAVHNSERARTEPEVAT